MTKRMEKERNWMRIGLTGFFAFAVIAAALIVFGNLFVWARSLLLFRVMVTLSVPMIFFALFGFLPSIVYGSNGINFGIKFSLGATLYYFGVIGIPFPYNMLVVVTLFPVILLWRKYELKKQKKHNQGKTDEEVAWEQELAAPREPGFTTEWMMVQRLAISYEVIKTKHGFYFIRGGRGRIRIGVDRLLADYSDGSAPLKKGRGFFIPCREMAKAKIVYGRTAQNLEDNCGKLRLKSEGSTREYLILGVAREQELIAFFHTVVG